MGHRYDAFYARKIPSKVYLAKEKLAWSARRGGRVTVDGGQ